MSEKHLHIEKAQVIIVAAVSGAVFVLMFSLFASRALLSQSAYHQRVIAEKKKALDVARENSKNAKELELVYTAFAGEPINVIGGNPTGTGPQDGSNPKIVLDALPSEYDYPALSSSIEKLLLDNAYQVQRIGGQEEPSLAGPSANAQPIPTEILYPITVSSTAEGSKNLLTILERSIRPFYINKLSLSGSGNSLESKIDMKTFYQPPTGVNVTTQVIK